MNLPESFVERFKANPETGCWNWTGFCNDGGYGLFSIKGNQLRAHRYAWQAKYGPLPRDIQLDHRHCRNKKCVNPDHLVPCTAAEHAMQPDSVGGLHAEKTHCIRGHELSGDNLYINIRGHRECRACKRIYDKKRANRPERKNYRSRSVVKQCETCGKDFHPHQGRIETHRFCSRACKRGPYKCR